MSADRGRRLQVDLSIFGTGWARIRIGAPGLYLDSSASWFEDTPGQLCRACVVLLDPSGEASVGAITEPGAYRLVLRRYGARVFLVLVSYPDEVLYLKAPPVGGRVSAIATGYVEELLLGTARAFLIERDRLGENGYRRLWGHDFPSKPLQSLCEAAVLERWSAA